MTHQLDISLLIHFELIYFSADRMTSIQKYLDYENVKVNFDKIYDAEQYWNQTIKDSIDNNWNQVLYVNLFLVIKRAPKNV